MYIEAAVSSRNSKRVWSAIKTVGRCVTRDRQKQLFSACQFSDYFCSSFSTLSLKNDRQTLQPVPGEIACNSVEFDTHLRVDVSEVCNVLNKLKKKSAGPDELPSWVFRECSLILAPAITVIFNRSFQLGRVPQCFKKAYISPIPKRTKPSDVTHYRPISLLPILSKCLERIVVRHWILPFISRRVSSTQFALSLIHI